MSFQPFDPFSAFGGGSVALSPLKDGLLDWWENASVTGAHSGSVLSVSPGPSISGPNGLLAWDVAAQAVTPFTVNRQGEWTLALVGRKSPLGDSSLFGDSTTSTWLGTYQGGSFKLFKVINPSGWYFTTRQWTDNVWSSFVVTFKNGSTAVYVNGELDAVGSNSETGNLLASVFSKPGPGGTFTGDGAICALASRKWDASDVALFHNAGNFQKYSDL